MTIRKKIIGGFVIIFIVGLILGAVGLASTRTLTEMSEELYHLQGASASVSNVLNAHYIWRQSLTHAVLTMEPFTGSIDPNGCALGKWKSSDTALNETDTEILSLLKQLDEPHNYIHTEAARIIALIEEGNQEEAKRILVEDILPKTEEAISILTAMTERYAELLDADSAAIVSTGNTTNVIIIAGIFAAFLLSLLMAYLITSSIMSPLRRIAAAAETISEGDVNVDVRHNVDDEVGKLAVAFDHILSTTKQQISIAETLADGDLTVEISPRSNRDAMNIALQRMVKKLETMFSEINNSTLQVSASSKQLADGSQILAQGSSEQASAVEQLSRSITEIAEKTKANADTAEKASRLADTIKENAEKGSHQMDDMVSAVREINQASQSINKVIKVIDDIAFQTNILALNAAVEAARAGQHGKGFAVVAEEVRNLAAKSASAAKDTGGLITSSIEKAELGARIADETASSLAEIVSGIKESGLLVGEIARSSNEQSTGIEQINKGIDQVAQVVQQNSATAEQSSAASEEMSGQAEVLEGLVAQFKLNKTHSIHGDYTPQKQLGGGTSYPDSASDYGKY